MIETISLGLLTVFTFYYIYFITRIRLGLLSIRPAQPLKTKPEVSVIVAARNEASNISKCLQSLLVQTYPTRLYEIIVVDDGSVDDTVSLVKEFSKRYSNIHILTLPIHSEIKYGRKPFAITYGIAQAKGDIILTTDADCTVPHKWIETMINYFEEGVVFVAGPVVEQANRSFFSHLEKLEFLGIIIAKAGLIGSGHPIGCNGANIGYRKNTFNYIQGYGENNCSIDDDALINRIISRKQGKIIFAFEPDAIVITHSSNTLSTFFHQRIRWANKRGNYEDKSVFIPLITLYLFFFSLMFTSMLLPIEPQLWLPLAIAFSGKIIIDYLTLKSGARLLQQHFSLVEFFIAEFLHVPYIVIAAAIGQFTSIQWKGRKI